VQLKDTVALVTGGTAGLGLATARRLVAAGARVLVMGRSEATGRAAADGLGPQAAFVAGDVTEDEAVGRVLDAAGEMGELRTVVCCAGTTYSKQILGRRVMRADEFEAVIRTNLIGTFNVIRQAVPRMAAQPLVEEDRGVVITTSSIAAWDGQNGQSAYAASKAAIAGMTLPLARELAPHAIRVVDIAPGLFDTRLTSAVPDGVLEQLRGQVPHPKRFGSGDEFAALAEHVIGNSMLNGETVRLDGGLRMAPH
jgi:NAD(P)-dependent dehydrogenase (short-subunit alcohol dehydrogenase family)